MTLWLNYNSQNESMVDMFTELAIITSKEVENAFRCVTRAAFVSKELLDEAFVDAPIRSHPHIHMSSPHLYATILENLELEPGMSFLNIGSGTGYFSCLAGYMIKKHGINHGVELHTDLVHFSQERIAEFFKYGPTGTRDICPPSLIAGNCFQLDQSQMKYDRLYCGGACSQSIITFFLGFLKVGGFLIAPNSTKLIKLERVSHNEGVKSVIRSVWFAPLTRLDPSDILKLRLGLLPRLRFPMKTSKEKRKKTFTANPSFLVCHSPARKKLSKLRAIQDALDSLERDGTLPLPFCYVPQLEQINAYKQYNNALECKPSKIKPTVEKSVSQSSVPITLEERMPLLSNTSASGQLPTIGETLTETEAETQYTNLIRDIMENTPTEENLPSSVTTTNIQEQLNLMSRNLLSGGELTSETNQSSPNIVLTGRSVDPPNTSQQGRSTDSSVVKCNSTVECANVDTELNGEISKDIWEHLCSDNLWKVVLDSYYSVCATTEERRRSCVGLKGIELVNPATTRLADMLMFCFQKKKRKKPSTGESGNPDTGENIKPVTGESGNPDTGENMKAEYLPCETVHTSNNCITSCTETNNCLTQTSSPNPSHSRVHVCNCKQLSTQDSEEKVACQCGVAITNETREGDVKRCLEELINNVCSSLETCDVELEKQALEELNICEGESEKQEFEESLDSVISFHSLSSASFLSTDESLHNSFENRNSETKSKSYKRGKHRLVDIRTDNVTSDNLLSVGGISSWTLDHDVELVSYLVIHGKECGNFPFKDDLPKLINCDFFDKSKLIRHPLISCIPAPLLCYRSIALTRVVAILDCVLDVLIGPSLPRNQFDSPFKEGYPLESFLDSSFLPSDSQLNVLEAQHLRKAAVADSENDILYQEAKSVQDEELLKEVFGIISNETSNVKQQQMILVRKLELIDNINEQYKEQIKLLTQQIDLIEEQQQLLFEVQMDTETSSQQLVTDRKQQRYTLIAKRQRINTDRMSQLAERKELLNMLEQLLSLETRLNNEMTSLERKGMGYLCGEGSDLSNFSQFVSKAEKILKCLRQACNRMSDAHNKIEVPDEKGSNDAAVIKRTSFRYQPNTILPRCRFLLPLSKKRYSYIREMLRSTERSPPKHMPIISVDRRVPLNERHANGAASTVFIQIYEALRVKELNYRWSKKSHEQWWEIRFSGEGIIDQGGGFRDSLVEIAEELCPPRADVESCLPLFIKTPNQKTGVGDHVDCYTLNPNCEQFHLYRWLGKLMGACFRTDEFLPLPLPPFIWKLIVGEYVYWKKDFRGIDEAAVRNIDGLENLDEDAYSGLNIEQTYSTVLSDGSEVELVANGRCIAVASGDRAKFSVMVRKARMIESCKQVKAIREGLLSVIPEGVLSCLTWRNVEKGVCGSPTISVADLKANCRYGDDLKVTSQCVLHMWTALASFTEEDRSRFVRFITGRKRLPSPFIVSRSSSEKDNLPSASTCGSNLFLPEYSSLQMAKDKIRYAIYNCIAIDTDTSPW